jgi:hypothetical protein
MNEKNFIKGLILKIILFRAVDSECMYIVLIEFAAAFMVLSKNDIEFLYLNLLLLTFCNFG